MDEKLIDILWEVKEGKKHPNRAYKELCALLNVIVRIEQLVCKCGLPKDKKGGSFNCMRTDCDMPIAN